MSLGNAPTLEELSALIDQLETDPTPPPERRRQARSLAKGIVKVLVEVEGGAPTEATLRDLSRGGIGLVMAGEVAVGTRFLFRATMGARSVRARCVVANCRPDGKGGFIVGGEMVEAERAAGGGAPATAQDPAADAPDVDRRQVAELRDRLAKVVAG